MDTNIFRKLSYGVYVISTWDNGRPTGCTANSAMQITSSPATIAVSVNHDNYTNHCISETGKFAVSILSEQTDPSVIGTFGFWSGKDTNKFEKVAYSVKDYMPVINDSCGYIACRVIDKMETATHTVFLDVWYHDRSYEFTASGRFDLPGTEGEETRLRELLAGYGVELPAGAGFAYEGNGGHSFTADFLPQGEQVVNGTLRCRYMEDGCIGEIESDLVTMTPYKEEAVISVGKALEELKRGNFQGGEMFAMNRVRRVTVLDCQLVYRADTKGFYQPLYAFLVQPEGMGEGRVFLPAMK